MTATLDSTAGVMRLAHDTASCSWLSCRSGGEVALAIDLYSCLTQGHMPWNTGMSRSSSDEEADTTEGRNGTVLCKCYTDVDTELIKMIPDKNDGFSLYL